MNTIEQQKQQIDDLLTTLTAHRWDEAAEAFGGASPAYEDMPSNLRLSGRAGIAHAYEILATALPDLSIEVVNATDAPGCSVRELVVDGTHLGNYQNIEATGHRVRFACACFFHFDTRGRLMTERVYFDNETLLRQMRGAAEPYLPRPLRVAA